MNAPDYISSEELLRILFHSPNATAVYGENMTILSANSAMLFFWGKDRSVVGKRLIEALPELEGQSFLGILEEVWRSGKTYVAKNVLASLEVDGKLQNFYFDYEYKAVLDESGNTEYILNTAFEVSERMAVQKVAEEKSRKEQELSESLAAINEEFQVSNEELSALNEEYQATNEELHRAQLELQATYNNLIESEGRFKSLVEHAPIAIAIFKGDDFIIEQANAQMIKIWGEDNHIIGKPVFTMKNHVEWFADQKLMDKVISDGIIYNSFGTRISQFIDGNINESYFDIIYKPLLDEGGHNSGIIMVANDVTQQTLARIREEEINEEFAAINEELTSANEELVYSREELLKLVASLNSSEERFRMMIEQSPVAMASLEGETLMVDVVNDKILEIWGKSKDIIGLPLHQALPEISGQPLLEILNRVSLTGEAFFGQELKATLSHNGENKDCYLNFVYQPVLDHNGKTHSILIVANDVTEQVEARQHTEELNTRLQIALDASKLGSTEVEIATGIMKSNHQFKKNYGYEADEDFSYKDLFNAMFPEYRERVRALVKVAIDTDGIYQAEYPIRWRDGSLHWIQAHGRPRYNAEGKADRMVGMTADITEAKLFEQRKDDFLSIASHELKTPITSLKASVQLLDRLKDKPFSDLHSRLMGQVIKSVDKMGVMVDELLNMNRMSQDQLQLERTTFNLYDMLLLSCSHVRLEGKYDLKISGIQDVMVDADEHRIDQVVVNFVNNAVKYAPESKDIEIGIEKVSGAVKVSVRDSGPGIQPHILPHLFDRYFRADHSGKKYSGLGLGLYICSEIIKKHGGQIGAESEIGTGSTFWFTIPI